MCMGFRWNHYFPSDTSFDRANDGEKVRTLMLRGWHHHNGRRNERRRNGKQQMWGKIIWKKKIGAIFVVHSTHETLEIILFERNWFNFFLSLNFFLLFIGWLAKYEHFKREKQLLQYDPESHVSDFIRWTEQKCHTFSLHSFKK